jgi:hypothetical protein
LLQNTDLLPKYLGRKSDIRIVFLGSAIIIASPVQPVLQGMVGMIPVSVVGQNGNTFSTPPQQVAFMN